MANKVLTVGDLRELLRYSEDEESLALKLGDTNIECVGASSAAGGRATILWFEKKEYANVQVVKR